MSAKALDVMPARQWRVLDGAFAPIHRAVPEETAIGVSYDSEPYAVLMASPADLEDLALGFTVTEKIARAGDVLDVRVGEHPDGLIADVLLSPEGRRSIKALRRRNLEARSSCGLCGVQTLEEAMRTAPPLTPGYRLQAHAVQTALAALDAHQTLGAATRATHAAAWADPAGALRLVREDVGRHNALDKLIGAAIRAGLDPATAFIIVTSRCSYEMVDKTLVAGVPALVAISAPTALAIRKAQAANLTLIALARADGFAVFAGERFMIDGVLGDELRTDLSAPA